MYTYIYICVCVCVHIYIYIYISCLRERKRYGAVQKLAIEDEVLAAARVGERGRGYVSVDLLD